MNQADGLSSNPRAGQPGKDMATAGELPAIPDHTVLRCIGRGSYGEVWLAQNLMGTWRAVKVVRRSSFDHAHPYDREFHGIQNYEPISRSHPGLMPILHVGRNDPAGYFYYVMELADDASTKPEDAKAESTAPQPGLDDDSTARTPICRTHAAGIDLRDSSTYRPQTLSAHVGHGRRLPVADCVNVGLSLAGALAHLHGRGLVHRDVKPSNVILVNGIPKLADIGLVTNADATLSFFVGTEGFVPPEGPGRPQADLFALGKTLYEISTGLDRYEYPRLPENLGEFPDRDDLCELSAVLEKACDPKTETRYRSAEELRDELLLLQSRKSVRHLRRLERWRERARVVGLVLVALAALASIGAAVAQRRAAEARGALLVAEAETIRLGERYVGWSSRASNLILQAASIRPDSMLRVYGATTLAGLDASPIAQLVDTGGSSVAWGSGGTSLLIGGGTNDGTKLLDVQLGNLSTASEPARGPVGFRDDGTPLQLTRSISGELLLRDGATGQELLSLPLPQDCSLTNDLMAMTPNGSMVAAAIAAPDGQEGIVVWSTGTGALSAPIDWAPDSLAFSTDGSLLASGTQDGRIRVWSLPDGRPLKSLHYDRTAVNALALCRSPSAVASESHPLAGWRLAAGHEGGKTAIWDLETGAITAHVSGLEFGVGSLAFNSDGTLLCAGGHYQVWVLDAARGRSLLRLGVNGMVRGLAFSQDDLRLACATDALWQPGGTYAWRLQDDRGIRTLRGLSTSVTGVVFSPAGNALAALSHDWRVAIWDPRSGRLLRLLDVPVGVSADNAAMVFSLDGTHFFFCAGTEAKLWEVATGRELGSWPLPLGIVDGAAMPEPNCILLFRDEQKDLDQVQPRLTGSLLKPRACRIRALRAPHEMELRREITNFSQRVYGAAVAPNGAWFVANGRWGAEDTTNGAIIAFEGRSGRQLWAIPWKEPNGLGSSVIWADPASKSVALNLTHGPGLPRYRVLIDVLGGHKTPIPYHDYTPFAGDRYYRAFCDPGASRYVLEVREGSRLTPYVSLDLSALGVPGLGGGATASPDGTLLAGGTGDGHVLVFDLAEIHQRLSAFPAGD